MLDGEIREQAMLKTALIASQRSVEELTQVIVLDNIGRLNAKYAKRNYWYFYFLGILSLHLNITNNNSKYNRKCLSESLSK